MEDHMKIVILDEDIISPGVWNNRSFDEFGEVIVYGRTPDELAAERIGNAELAVTESTKIAFRPDQHRAS